MDDLRFVKTPHEQALPHEEAPPPPYLVVVDQLLLDDLHGVDALRLLQLHQQHLGVAASADDPQEVEVGQAQAGRRLAGVSAAAGLGGRRGV